MIVSVNARPPDGPLTSPVAILIFTGKSTFRTRVTAEIPHDRATEERVMFAATGNMSDETDDPAAPAASTADV